MTFMRHKFLVLTVKKMVKIGAHLRKLSQNENRGTVFLDHPVVGATGYASCSHVKQGMLSIMPYFLEPFIKFNCHVTLF